MRYFYPAMNEVKTFFSSRSAGLLCLFIAVVSRIINVLFISYAGRDKMLLVLQSKSLLEGNGLGVPEYFTFNPQVPVFDYTPYWPPGYPVLLAPFLKIFNYNIYWATTTVDIIACVALIFVIRKICKQVGFSSVAINLMTLVAGCFEYPFINDSKPTDNVPIVIFLLGISMIIKLLLSDRFSFVSIIAATFVLFLPSVFRYSYPPLSLAIGVSVFFTGFLKKEKVIIKKGAWLFALNLVLIAVFMFTMKAMTGYAGYAVPTERGFFPENLVHWFPIVPASFINIPFLTSQSTKVAGLSFETTMLLLEVINVIAVLSMIVVFFFLFLKKRFLAALTPFKWFLITGFSASAATFVSLGYLSFTYAPQDWRTTLWSYVYDHRYYAFIVIFLQVVFLGWIFLYKNSVKNFFLRIIAFFFALALFIEITHNIYFNTKVASNFKEYKSNVYREQDYAYFFSLIKELEKKYPDYDIWSASPADFFYPYVATFRGHKGISDAVSFKNSMVKVKRKTILTLMLYDHEVAEYTGFLSRSNILYAKKIQNSNNYVIELLP